MRIHNLYYRFFHQNSNVNTNNPPLAEEPLSGSINILPISWYKRNLVKQARLEGLKGGEGGWKNLTLSLPCFLYNGGGVKGDDYPNMHYIYQLSGSKYL